MTRRMKIGLATGIAVAVLGTGTAFAVAAHGHRGAIMKRVVTAVVDDALDHAKATAEQRREVHQVRDRVLQAVEAHRQGRGARMTETLALFESDRLDASALRALRGRIEQEHRQIGDVLAQAVEDVHRILTPEQRRALADYVRSHRHGPRG